MVGGKPLVLTRAIVLGSLFPAAEDPADWPKDLAIFLRCLTLDDPGMWKRKTAPLPAELCWPHATAEEQAALFADPETWRRGRAVDRELRQALERRAFYTLREQVHAEQRRVYEEVDAWIVEQGLETS